MKEKEPENPETNNTQNRGRISIQNVFWSKYYHCLEMHPLFARIKYPPNEAYCRKCMSPDGLNLSLTFVTCHSFVIHSFIMTHNKTSDVRHVSQRNLLRLVSVLLYFCYIRSCYIFHMNSFLLWFLRKSCCSYSFSHWKDLILSDDSNDRQEYPSNLSFNSIFLVKLNSQRRSLSIFIQNLVKTSFSHWTMR